MLTIEITGHRIDVFVMYTVAAVKQSTSCGMLVVFASSFINIFVC